MNTIGTTSGTFDLRCTMSSAISDNAIPTVFQCEPGFSSRMIREIAKESLPVLPRHVLSLESFLHVPAGVLLIRLGIIKQNVNSKLFKNN